MRERWLDCVGLAAALLLVGWSVPGGAPRLLVLVLVVAVFPALLLAAAAGGGRRRLIAAAGLAPALVVPWLLVAGEALGAVTLGPGASALVLCALVLVPLVWLVVSFAREPYGGRSRERDAAR